MIHYYQPELAPGWLLPEPDRFEEKFGGLPWGFPVEKWPVCTLCEVSLPLVAQLRHHPKRLDLGKEGRVLFFFLCQDDHCVPESTWHVEILEEAELGHGCVRPEELPVRELPEVRVSGWLEKTEKPPDEAWKCWDSEAWDREWFELTEKIEEGLKLGGLPCWNRAPHDYSIPSEWKKGTWRFAAQFEPQIWLPGSVEDDHWIQIMNAGDETTGYLFIDPDPVHPKGLFFTQVF